MKAHDDDWMFPNRIKKGKTMKRGPIWHETLLERRIQPVADKLGLPHITWRLLRHRGATQMVEERVPIKAAQQRLGHPSRHTSQVLRAFSRRVRRCGGRIAEPAVEQRIFRCGACAKGCFISDFSLIGSLTAARGLEPLAKS
jgi:integrase